MTKAFEVVYLEPDAVRWRWGHVGMTLKDSASPEGGVRYPRVALRACFRLDGRFSRARCH